MKIPATVITGFLGAGKTTLLRHLLATADGRRLALVINEFGDVGLDREILLGCGIEDCREDDVVELANGCICCTVADDFLPMIGALVERPHPPDHIVIETSGLALPKPLLRAFNWPEIRARVTVDGVVAVVDGPAVAAGQFADDPNAVNVQRRADAALDHDSPLAEVFEDQLLAADLVLLNKADLLDPTALDRVRRDVGRAVRPSVKVVPSAHARVAARVLLGLEAAAEDDLDSRPSHHDDEDGEHDHDDFETFSVLLDDVADPARLEERIERVAADHDVLRIKGIVHVSGKPMRHVIQGVGPRVHRYYDRPWGVDEDRRGRLVVIGLSGLDRPAIEAALAG